jgi:hypothetical protein
LGSKTYKAVITSQLISSTIVSSTVPLSPLSLFRVKVQTRTRPMKIQTSDTKPDFLILINTKKFDVYWEI